MESNEKKINIFTKIKRHYREFMFGKEECKKLEEFDKKPFKKKFKKNFYSYFVVVVLIAIFIWTIVSGLIKEESRKQRIEENKGTYILNESTKRVEKQITFGKLNRYMVDKTDNSYIDITSTKLDDKVAYSLTYKCNEVLPQGKLAKSKRFTKGYITSILAKGYPNISYMDMKLNNEEEAYMATQLAVYAMVSKIKYDTSNGEFILDNIIPSEEKYTDMVNRVLEKANELYIDALEKPYVSQVEGNCNYYDSKINIENNIAMVGPFYDWSVTDEYTKVFLGNSYDPKTQINVNNYIESSNAKVVDEQGNEISYIRDGECYYIKIDNVDKIFSQFKTCSENYSLYSSIYKSENFKHQYVILDTKKTSFYTIESIIHNIDSGKVNIKFIAEDGKPIENVKYRIYYNDTELIQDVEGFDYQYEFSLPIGKYHIEVYDLPDKCFLEEKTYGFEINSNQIVDLNIYIDSLL